MHRSDKQGVVADFPLLVDHILAFAAPSCQHSPACNIMLSATLGMTPPVSSSVSSLQICVTCLASFSVSVCHAFLPMHVPWADGVGTVTGDDTEKIAEAHVAQCSINNIVNVYVPCANHMSSCVGDRSSWLAKGQSEV